MDGSRLGRSIRALRRRRGWRQSDLAVKAGTSQSTVSKIERGRIASVDVGLLERVADSLDASLVVDLRWRGEGLDRLLDREHARLVEEWIARLRSFGWETVPEASFSFFGERGSIDILAHHAATRTCLVVEVKSVVPDVQAMLVTLDRKARLAPQIARDRGWRVELVGRLLVLPDDRTARRRIAQHAETFAVAFPVRGVAVRRWLRAPGGSMAGLSFLAPTRRANGKRGSAAGRQGVAARERVRVPPSRTEVAGGGAVSQAAGRRPVRTAG